MNKNSVAVPADYRKFLGKTLRPEQVLDVGFRFFHVSKTDLQTGSLLHSLDFQERPHYSFFMPAPPVQFMNQADFRARRSVELSFERYRADAYPTLPGRKTSLFASISMADASFWNGNGKERNKGRIFEFQLVGDCRVLLVDLIWFNYAVRVVKNPIVTPNPLEIEIISAADRYWGGISGTEFGAESRIEALIEGNVIVSTVHASSDQK